MSNVIAPHEVQDQSKYEALVVSYRAGGVVAPFVVLVVDRRDGGPTEAFAVSGSHRIAAAAEAFGDALEAPHVVADFAAVLAAAVAADDCHGQDWLRDLAAGRHVDFTCCPVEYLPADAQAAMVDQL